MSLVKILPSYPNPQTAASSTMHFTKIKLCKVPINYDWMSFNVLITSDVLWVMKISKDLYENWIIQQDTSLWRAIRMIFMLKRFQFRISQGNWCALCYADMYLRLTRWLVFDNEANKYSMFHKNAMNPVGKNKKNKM